jgi:hypothetical protein
VHRHRHELHLKVVAEARHDRRVYG